MRSVVQSCKPEMILMAIACLLLGLPVVNPSLKMQAVFRRRHVSTPNLQVVTIARACIPLTYLYFY